ncbi:MAG TPA: flagellar filament capping protein FliD [Gemmatimonadales bacterium]|nr:flagellar filament capping protein FliD [Gemmatimonadales bacterium]
MTTPLSSVSGVVSGIDWQSLVDKIIQADGAPQTALKNEVTAAGSRVSSWQSYGTLLQALQSAESGLRDGSAFTATTASVTSPGYTGPADVSVTTSPGAVPGSYQVDVVGVAQAEKVSGGVYASASTALGLSGEFFVNGAKITVAATDTLSDIRDKINAANSGSAATKVTATVLTTSATDNRLELASDVTGATGVDLKDGASALLVQLGLLDGTTTIKRQTSSGAAGDRFASAGTAVKTLLGLTDGGGPETVTIGGQALTIDLSTQSLNDIAAGINSLSGVTASVKSETVSGTTRYYLDVRGTTSFTDSGGTLELLGLVEGGRSGVAQQVQGDALTAGGVTTPATASTLLADLWTGGTAANVHAGDTLAVSGTRGDGTAVSLTYTVGGGDTVQTLLDRLNSTTDGFRTGQRPATALIDAQGRLTVTDGTSGDSRLAVSIVAHNEGGGHLDLGAFTADVVGRQRTLVAGADATFQVDGVTMQRSSNVVTDAIPDVTLTLQGAQSHASWSVSIARDSKPAVSALNALVTAYNNIASFVNTQNTAPASGQAASPLYGDSSLKAMRSSLAQALIQVVPGASSDYASATSVGLSLDQNGQLSLDAGKFQTAFTADYSSIEQLFVPQKSATDPQVNFTALGPSTVGGTYDVVITNPATPASVTGSGFSGTYADDGTSDTMVVTDKATGWSAQLSLSNGMTAAQIVGALNTAFAASAAQKLSSTATLYADPSGTVPATAATRWGDLRGAGGAALGVAAGDTISYAGTRGDGTPVAATYTIGDPASATIGDLVSQMQQDLGTGVTVSIVAGQLVVEASQTGGSNLALTVTANNQGGGSLSFGSMARVTQGRNALPITASQSGSQLVLTGGGLGSAAGFSVSFLPGGADGTAQLGIAARSYTGQDVAGTIGGYGATGSGQQLTGSDGTPVAGLVVAYAGNTARAAGQVTLSVGLAELLGRMVDAWLDPTKGLLATTETALNQRITDLNAGVSSWDTRLAAERTRLVQQYSTMEATIAKLQTQSAALSQQFSSAAVVSKGVLG